MHFEISDLFPLVKELSEQYTGKVSTSVSYETAAQLMEGILYCIAQAELCGEYQEERFQVTSSKDSVLAAREAYQFGYKQVIEKVISARRLYNDLIMDFDSYGNHIYDDTVKKALSAFFLWYDAKYRPQDAIITFDYPVLIRSENQSGINAIYEYIICLSYEQKFLKQMPRDFCVRVLEQSYYDFEELVINLCSIMMKKLILNFWLEQPLQKIEWNQKDAQKACHLVRQNRKEQLTEELCRCLKQMIDRACQGDEKVYLYLKEGIPDIVSELVNRAENNCMESIF